MKRYFSKFAKVALLLGLFVFPGHELIMHVIESVAAQTYPNGVIITSPVVVPGSFNFNGGPQVSVVKANGGTFTCVSASAVTVTNANVDANSVFLFGLNTAHSPGNVPYVSTVTVGTSFAATCASGDTSVYNYVILG